MATNPAADMKVQIVTDPDQADQVVTVVGDQVLTATAADVGKILVVQADGSFGLATDSGPVQSVDGDTGNVDLSGDYAPIAEPVAAAHIIDGSAAHAASAVSYAGGTGMSATDVEAALDELATEKADLASPTFTGNPAAPTAAASDDDTSIATTAHVKDVAQQVFTHSAGAYVLTGGRLFIGTEDPVADGYTMAAGDEWVSP